MLWILTFDFDVALPYGRVNHFHHFMMITSFLFHNTQKLKKIPAKVGLLFLYIAFKGLCLKIHN